MRRFLTRTGRARRTECVDGSIPRGDSEPVLPPSCPRCQAQVIPPGPYASQWRCSAHGAVAPLRLLRAATDEGLAHIAGLAKVPTWMPIVDTPGWEITELGFAGDGRTGARATVLAAVGPAPLGAAGERAELIVVAEEPEVGLGAAYAGHLRSETRPTLDGPPAAKILAGGHPTPLWSIGEQDDRAAFVGEAGGVWLWMVLFPASAGYLLAEPISLVDVRHKPTQAGARFGVGTSRLTLRDAT
jgi:hypothetical protein